MFSSTKSRKKPKKSVITQLALKKSAREIFESGGYAAVTVQKIVEISGMASGTFYIYWKNKSDILLDIANEFLELVESDLDHVLITDDAYVNIYNGQLVFIKRVTENWQLYRSLVSFSFDEPKLRERWHMSRVHEGKRTAAAITLMWQKHAPAASIGSPETTLAAAMALNSMTEGYVQDLLRSLNAGERPTSQEIEELAHFLARIFYRSAFMEEPKSSLARL